MREVHVDAREADDQIRRMAVAISDLRPFWPRVATLARGWIRLQFDSEGAFWGQGARWTPLSPAYAERKRQLFGEKPILEATGQMRRAFSRPERTQTPRSLTLHFDDSGEHHGPVAQYHQEGAPRLPRRQIIGEQLPPLADWELARAADAYVGDFFRRF